MSDAQAWLLGAAVLACSAIVATLWRIGSAQRALVALQADANLHARYVDQLERLKTPEAVEALAAQLAALAFSRPIALRAGLLHVGAEPTPYFTITDIAGVRYFFTTQPHTLRRSRIVRRSDPTRDLSFISVAARADIAAVWCVLAKNCGMAHVALPRRAAWRIIAFNPTRRASLAARLRSLLRARRVANATHARTVSTDARAATASIDETAPRPLPPGAALPQLAAGDA